MPQDKYLQNCKLSTQTGAGPQGQIVNRDCSQLVIVVPCFNEGLLIAKTAEVLRLKLVELIAAKVISPASYILFIDDGSSDQTWSELVKLPGICFRALQFSRNYGHQCAVLAGMNYAYQSTADCVISIDADLQQDVDKLPEFIEKFQKEQADLVLGVRRDRSTDSSFKKATAVFFYWFMTKMGVNIVANHADYRLVSARILAVLQEFEESSLFLRALILSIGFKREIVYFDVKSRALGESKYSLGRMMNLALDGITSFSVRPLRFVAVLGFFTFLSSIFMITYIFIATLSGRGIVPGWASTVLPVYLIGGIQLICTGILGEYIGKIYVEVKARPKYIIKDKIVPH